MGFLNRAGALALEFPIVTIVGVRLITNLFVLTSDPDDRYNYIVVYNWYYLNEKFDCGLWRVRLWRVRLWLVRLWLV